MQALCKQNCKYMIINHMKILPKSLLRKWKEISYLNEVMANTFVKITITSVPFSLLLLL